MAVDTITRTVKPLAVKVQMQDPAGVLHLAEEVVLVANLD